MANTFELIASYTATGSVSSIDFTSIPSTYTDLVLKTSTRSNNSGTDNAIITRFNNDSTIANYNDRILYGNGSSAASIGSAGATGLYWYYSDGNTATANTFASGEMYIPNYAGSTNKSVSMDAVTENNATGVLTILSCGVWSSSSAINRITLVPNSSASFLQYTTAYLYGVKNA